MKIYLVGGAVRDELLGQPVTERDYVVVGASEEDMLAAGFTRVGKDFPVFLHPDTKEEYALARTERKSGHGYRGFVFVADPGITLEEDLIRRDLTINSMAKSETGEIIDPYGGLQDLQNKILRHTSEAFKEDPVRILRVARFAARYAHLGFTVHPGTIALMREIANSGEVNHLVAERIWKEFSRALTEKNPEVFFTVLHSCGALKIVMPELIFDIEKDSPTEPAVFFQNFIDTCKKTQNPLVRFANLLFPLAQAKQTGQANAGLAAIENLCHRISAPKIYFDMARLVASYQNLYSAVLTLPATDVLELLHKTDAIRNSERFEIFMSCCELLSENTREKSHFLRSCINVIKNIRTEPIIHAGFFGAAFGKELDRQRVSAIEQIKSSQPK